MQFPRDRFTTMILDEGAVFKKRDYIVIPATEDQQTELETKTGKSEYYPKTIWGAIAGTARLGRCEITMGNQIAGRIYNAAIYNEHEISQIETVYTQEPEATELIKPASRGKKYKGEIWDVIAEGAQIRKTEKFERPTYHGREHKTMKHEFHREDKVKYIGDDATYYGKEAYIVNAVHPMAAPDYYKIRFTHAVQTGGEVDDGTATYEYSYTYKDVNEDEMEFLHGAGED